MSQSNYFAQEHHTVFSISYVDQKPLSCVPICFVTKRLDPPHPPHSKWIRVHWWPIKFLLKDVRLMDETQSCIKTFNKIYFIFKGFFFGFFSPSCSPSDLPSYIFPFIGWLQSMKEQWRHLCSNFQSGGEGSVTCTDDLIGLNTF